MRSGRARASFDWVQAPGAAQISGATTTEERQPTVQIIVQGSVIGDIDDLARRLSEAVVERDVNLTA